MIRNYQVYFFLDQRGSNPVFEYMNNRNQSEYITLYLAIKRLSTSGLELIGTNMVKKIGKNLFEIKKDMHRIIFTINKEDSFLLLNAFYKKTNKTPFKEKDRANRNFEDYLQYGNCEEVPFP